MYQYSGYDTLGVQIIEGSLFFEYGDSSSISGVLKEQVKSEKK